MSHHHSACHHSAHDHEYGMVRVRMAFNGWLSSRHKEATDLVWVEYGGCMQATLLLPKTSHGAVFAAKDN